MKKKETKKCNVQKQNKKILESSIILLSCYLYINISDYLYIINNRNFILELIYPYNNRNQYRNLAVLGSLLFKKNSSNFVFYNLIQTTYTD